MAVATLQRNVLKEMSIVFPIVLVCLNFVLMMEKILQFSRFLSGAGSSIGDFIYMIMYIQPQLLILTMPMSFLLTLLLVYGRMNMDMEIVIMRSIGMSMRQISLPAAVIGTVVFILSVSITFYISPASTKGLRKMMNEIVRTKAPLALEAGIFHDSIKDVTLLIGSKDSPSEMKDIFIYDVSDRSRPRLIVSRSGQILVGDKGETVMDIREGFINLIDKGSFTEMSFERYVFGIDLGNDLKSARREERTPFELIKDTRWAKGRQKMKFYTEFHRRFTLPLMSLFLILLGPALSMLSGRRGRLAGFIYGILVFGLYYFFLIYVEGLVHSEKIHHIFAWAPILLFGAVSLTVYIKGAQR